MELTGVSATLDAALARVRDGGLLLLYDGARPDLGSVAVCAAELVTDDAINFMAHHGSGVVYVALTGERCRELGLPPMAPENDSRLGINFTVSIEARSGVTTGISAGDRACTIRVAVGPDTGAEDLSFPGHVFPVAARPGGVLERVAFTEAGVELARLAGLAPGSAVCALLNDQGELLTRTDLAELAHSTGLMVLDIQEIVRHRLVDEPLVELLSDESAESHYGPLRIVVHRSRIDGSLIRSFVFDSAAAGRAPLVHVRVQSALGDVLGAGAPDGDFDFGDLDAALRGMAAEGAGVFVAYCPGRTPAGPGGGSVVFDCTNAVVAQVLRSLGADRARLLTNLPSRGEGLAQYGIAIRESIPASRCREAWPPASPGRRRGDDPGIGGGSE